MRASGMNKKESSEKREILKIKLARLVLLPFIAAPLIILLNIFLPITAATFIAVALGAFLLLYYMDRP